MSQQNTHSTTFLPANSTVYQYLCRFHAGKASPIKAKNLAAVFHMDLRSINEEIRQLRKSGILIGSIKTEPAGYYIPANEEEEREYIDVFKKELFDMLQTLNIQKRALKRRRENSKTNDLFTYKYQPSGQIEMALY